MVGVATNFDGQRLIATVTGGLVTLSLLGIVVFILFQRSQGGVILGTHIDALAFSAAAQNLPVEGAIQKSMRKFR